MPDVIDCVSPRSPYSDTMGNFYEKNLSRVTTSTERIFISNRFLSACRLRHYWLSLGDFRTLVVFRCCLLHPHASISLLIFAYSPYRPTRCRLSVSVFCPSNLHQLQLPPYLEFDTPSHCNVITIVFEIDETYLITTDITNSSLVLFFLFQTFLRC